MFPKKNIKKNNNISNSHIFYFIHTKKFAIHYGQNTICYIFNTYYFNLNIHTHSYTHIPRQKYKNYTCILSDIHTFEYLSQKTKQSKAKVSLIACKMVVIKLV